ncbi:accessory gland protein Acp29AB [Drosophila yakuba]|uniref:C-type lectin domain-containing protein n=1 Tax=Drosophila yakuba TaxID=7245 RepID=B4P3M4_DROYA|nr:accessory gland protein Acp29AB [Drosophila yakuba]EDW87291.1 uncharacterized protein Dyak_GE15379 [Drosophila yakuba]
MCGLRTCFLCLVVASCILFGVSHSINESVCVLSNAPQQCGAFCLAALHPLYDQYSKSRQQESSQEAMVKIIAAQAEQKELLNVLAANITSTASSLKSTLQSMPCTLLPVHRIGSRFYIIVYKEKSMIDAAKTCREKGGHLAAFRNEDEFEAVTRFVNKHTYFWLGFHRNSTGVFVTATGNERPFIKWESGEPKKGGDQNCVVLFKSRMLNWKCCTAVSFICELEAD